MKLDLNALAVESFPTLVLQVGALAPTYPYRTCSCPPPI